MPASDEITDKPILQRHTHQHAFHCKVQRHAVSNLRLPPYLPRGRVCWKGNGSDGIQASILERVQHLVWKGRHFGDVHSMRRRLRQKRAARVVPWGARIALGTENCLTQHHMLF